MGFVLINSTEWGQFFCFLAGGVVVPGLCCIFKNAQEKSLFISQSLAAS